MMNSGGQVGDGEAGGCGGQGEYRGQGSADPGFVQVDPAHASGADLGGLRQLIEGVIGQEAGIEAVQRGGESVDHAGEPADDLPEAVQDPAAAQLFGVMNDRLEAQHMFAFGVTLQRQERCQDLTVRSSDRPDPYTEIVNGIANAVRIRRRSGPPEAVGHLPARCPGPAGLNGLHEVVSGLCPARTITIASASPAADETWQGPNWSTIRARQQVNRAP